MTGNAEYQDASSLVELEGRIERITFTNVENGFTVAQVSLLAKGDRRPVTVVGVMLDPTPGQHVVVQGEWREDPRWGRQFKASSCRLLQPTGEAGVRMYLKSGLVKGVGEKYADRIVDRFGADTIKVLDDDPRLLLQVEGIGKKRLEKIMQAWSEHQEIRELMLFLQAHEVSAAQAVRIFKFYGADSLRVVKENPYQLARDIPGVGFLTADRIAAKLGFAQDCDLRIEAGTLHVLKQSADKGHVFLPEEQLRRQTCELLEAGEEQVRAAVEVLVGEGRVKVEAMEQPHHQGVYLAPYYTAEKSVAARLKKLVAAPKVLRHIEAEKAIVWVQSEQGITLASKQSEAVRQAAENKVLVVTGGPGTGKTTIIKAILRIFQAMAAKTLLAAPTGRAAKRMAEATGHEAKTIHRLLEYSAQSGSFSRDSETPLVCDLLIVDEASMIDIVLMHHLLKAVTPGATLILVGDVNQLPSIGPGNVLGDIIRSERVSVVELNEIFRQARQSAIVVNAHAINAGRMPDCSASNRLDSDFYFFAEEVPERAAELVVDLVKNRIPGKFGFRPWEDIQVLSPMHRGAVGVENLNLLLQAALNPEKRAINRGGRSFRLGDKVMQIKNNYDKDIFNGDIGRIVDLDLEERTARILFDEREILFEHAELDEIIPAYAVSIHKSQGSEYPAVVVPILTQHYALLQRNLLYTAVTRGKRLVVLVGSRRALGMAVNNNVMQNRYTYLEQRLAL